MDNDIRVGDVVQAVKGSDKATFGIVLEVIGQEYKCWLKTPIDESGRQIHFRLRAGDCEKVGKAILRPTRPGEKPQLPPQQQPQTTKAQPVLPARATVAPSVAPPVERAAQAGADLPAEAEDEFDPEMMKPIVFRGPSAFEAHNLQPPESAVPTTSAPEDIETHNEDPLSAPVKRKRHVRMKNSRRGAK